MATVALYMTAIGPGIGNERCTGCNRLFGRGERMAAIEYEDGDGAGWFCDECIAEWKQRGRPGSRGEGAVMNFTPETIEESRSAYASMDEPAPGEDAGVDCELARMRSAGWSWRNCRCGIVAKTPKNVKGKHGTTIWYGEHEVTWCMIRTRPRKPRVHNG